MTKRVSLVIAVVLLFSLFHPPLGAEEKIASAEVIAKHLSAIGSEEARKKNEARTLEGLCAVKFIVGGHGVLQGTAKMLSREKDFRYTTLLGAIDYPGEDFIKAGDKTSIAVVTPGKRSALGDFLYFYPEIMREGLLGGTMSAAWPLENMDAHEAKLVVKGTKNIGGKKLYEVMYLPRNASSDLDIRLYFDPQNFQHVLTRYHLKIHAFPGIRSSNGGSPDTTSDVEERFSDFHEVDGITIPLRWIIHYEVEGGTTIDYEMVAQRAGHSVAADAFKAP